MHIAVILSGTIRFHHKSYDSIQMLRECGHQVDPYIHCWKGASLFQGDAWSWHFPPTEPTSDILDSYAPKSWVVEDWPVARKEIVEQVELWKRWNALKHFTHYGMPGMWRSLQSAYVLITEPWKYDAFVRLRFDGAMLGGDIMREPGWHVPNAVDFGGLCDQLAWYVRRPGDDGKLKQDLDAYFLAYSWMGVRFDTGCHFSPEILLKKNMDALYNGAIHRPNYPFSIHND